MSKAPKSPLDAPAHGTAPAATLTLGTSDQGPWFATAPWVEIAPSVRREYYAALILQGMVVHGPHAIDPERAVKLADELMGWAGKPAPEAVVK